MKIHFLYWYEISCEWMSLACLGKCSIIFLYLKKGLTKMSAIIQSICPNWISLERRCFQMACLKFDCYHQCSREKGLVPRVGSRRGPLAPKVPGNILVHALFLLDHALKFTGKTLLLDESPSYTLLKT